ncbi:MAG: hypothetical protein JXA54_13585 [Candidatus Heimdallarchaeota archaeon]|nr:hypothetical protein [Candidatus Heimdallarchaeota archaeon]
MDWKACYDSGLVKTIKVDPNLVRSLIKESLKKLSTQDQILLTEETASSKITLAYDSVRMLLEAIAIKNGYKVYNHDCYKAFLKEVLKKSILGEEFDKHRKIRNSINYYGKEIKGTSAKIIIDQLVEFHQKLMKYLG